MKKTGIFSFILALMLAVSVCLSPAYAETDPLNPAVEYGCSTVDAKVPFLGSVDEMDLVTSAILYEANSETLMYALNADEPMYPASLVKIMTALIVLREGTLSDVVTVTKEVLDTVPQNAVTVKLYTDEVITVEDLLYCMMVASANDAAAVLADHIAGSQSAFVAKMNQYAEDIGCTATEFTDVHGLDGKQKTTARDMARILAEALKDPQFQEIFGTVYYTTAPTNKMSERSLASGNYLLNDDDVKIYQDSRVTGSRTGTQDNGDRCIASTATANGMQMVCVILGAKNVYADNGSTRVFGGYNETSHLLDVGFDGLQCVQVLYENQALKQTRIENGDSHLVLGPDTDASCVLPLEVTPDKLTYKYGSEDPQLPVAQGDYITDVQVWYGNICVAQSGLYALNKVQHKLLSNQNIDGSEDGGSWFLTVLKVIGILALIVGAVVLGLQVYNRVQYAARQKRSRRHRRNRRRSR